MPVARTVLALAATAGLVAALGGAVPAGATVPGGVPARVVVYQPPVGEASYAGVDHGRSDSPRDDRYSRTTWRVVQRTGNCCENYLTSTPDGRLLDFGGSYVNYSDDRGLTWRQVQPLSPLVNGEGAIVAAPDGDVLGVGWDPYSGDHLQSYKYEADTGQWLYDEIPVHQPFYDREWISVVPGPVTIDGVTHPWVSLVKGGYPSKEVWYVSTDGLDYSEVTSKFADELSTGSRAGNLDTVALPASDWVQPNTGGGMTPLGNGGMLASPDFPGVDWATLDGSSFSWTGFNYADGSEPDGRHQLDSRGWLHNVVAGNGEFTYRVSQDGGKTWARTVVRLPAGDEIEEMDFRANAGIGVAAVGVHAHDNTDSTDQDLAFKLDVSRAQPRLLRTYDVGLGDVNGSSGVGADVRFDFETLTLLPDGRIAMSFYDTTTTDEGGDIQPAMAVEQDTRLGGRVPPADGGTGTPPVLGTPYASYRFDDGPQGWTTAGVPTWARGAPGEAAGQDDAATASYGIDRASYVDNMDATLTSPPVGTQAGTAVLDYWVRHDTEAGFDTVASEWSTDGKTWHPIGSVSGRSAGYPGWDHQTVGFDSPGGDVQVRFHFTSDLFTSGLSGGYDGARVDEVTLGQPG